MALFCSFAFAGFAQSLGAAWRPPKLSIQFVDLSSHGFVLPFCRLAPGGCGGAPEVGRVTGPLNSLLFLPWVRSGQFVPDRTDRSGGQRLSWAA
jgi:hypothetical protein